MNNIRNDLLSLKDDNYQAFSSKLINNIDPKTIIGVRIPGVRSVARKYGVDYKFLNDLPHKYYEENMVHMIMIGNIKDFDECIEYIEKFLPYMNCWSLTDSVTPIAFKKNKTKILPYIKKWIKSSETYTIRFGISILMSLFLNEDFDIKHLDLVAKIKSDEYYVNMMRAWYFATALYSQYDSAIKIIENHELDLFTHNKSIQKAIESFRVSDEHKDYLRTLRISTFKKQD